MILTLLSSLPASAGICDWLARDLKSLVLGKLRHANSPGGFEWKGNQILSPEELASWQLRFRADRLNYPRWLTRRGIEHVDAWLRIVPEELRSQIRSSLPREQEQAIRFFRELKTALGSEVVFPEAFIDYLRLNGSSVEWLLDALGARGVQVDPRISADVQLGMREAAARWNWLARTSRPVEVTGTGARLTLRFGEAQWQAKKASSRSGELLIVGVQARELRSPHWNPVNLEHAGQLALNGEGPPKVFTTVLGWDGHFWLLDGNHRAQQLSPDQWVEVSIPYPAETASLPIFYDLIGRPQPALPELIELLENHRTLESFL